MIDLSGFLETVKRVIWKWLIKDKPYRDFQLKPFDCSLCMSHHIMLLYVILTGQFSIYIWLLICGLSYMTKHFTALLRLVSDAISKAENKIDDILQ